MKARLKGGDDYPPLSFVYASVLLIVKYWVQYSSGLLTMCTSKLQELSQLAG